MKELFIALLIAIAAGSTLQFTSVLPLYVSATIAALAFIVAISIQSVTGPSKSVTPSTERSDPPNLARLKLYLEQLDELAHSKNARYWQAVDVRNDILSMLNTGSFERISRDDLKLVLAKIQRVARSRRNSSVEHVIDDLMRSLRQNDHASLHPRLQSRINLRAFLATHFRILPTNTLLLLL